MQTVDRATINEVRRFVFSGPLTADGIALRDVTHVTKWVGFVRDAKFECLNICCFKDSHSNLNSSVFS